MEPLTFDDIDLRIVPVKLGSATYELREANADVACRWKGKVSQHTTVNSVTKEITNDGQLAALELDLVAECLYTDQGELAGMAFVKALPARVTTALFKRAVEISGLDDDAEEEAGER